MSSRWRGMLPVRQEHNSELGSAAERRFVQECEDRRHRFPLWLIGFTPATRAEDLEGTDVWAETDAGRIALQIKRSNQQQARFQRRENRKHIPCIVVAPHVRFDNIFAFTISLVTRERKKLLVQTGSPG